jgi:hypothetical protein
MHLEGPWLSTTGKRKSKVKYKSAEAKRQAEELAREWENIKNKYKSTTTKFSKPTMESTKNVANNSKDVEQRPKSLNSWITGAVSSKPSQQYTGSMVKGITVMHKSCLQPVFTEQEAIDAAHMRR